VRVADAQTSVSTPPRERAARFAAERSGGGAWYSAAAAGMASRAKGSKQQASCQRMRRLAAM